MNQELDSINRINKVLKKEKQNIPGSTSEKAAVPAISAQPVRGTRVISTRRLSARPSTVSLSATG